MKISITITVCEDKDWGTESQVVIREVAPAPQISTFELGNEIAKRCQLALEEAVTTAQREAGWYSSDCTFPREK